MMTLSPSASRAAALALLALALFLLFAYLVAPLYKVYTDKLTQVSNLGERLARYEHLLATMPAINEQIADIDAMAADSDLFLKGNKVAIASANLREFVNETVEAAGGELISSQEYEAQPVPSATPVGLQLEVSGEVRNLIDLLYMLENARPLIFIDDFAVSSSASRIGISRKQRRTKSSRGHSGSLAIRLNIVGYLPGEQS
jgi:general secretion pathway protein M